jgi:hypothetical protein
MVDVGWFTVGLLASWLLLSGLVARMASKKGQSPVTWFIVALVISPLLAAILVAVMSPAPTPFVPPNISEELSRFAALRDSGALSSEEFESQKARLLAMTVAPPGPRPVGSRCGNCGKPVSPAWKTKCNHCGASFDDFPPVLPAAT